MTAGQRSTTWNSPPAAPALFGLRWLRRESIQALSVQRVLANPSCLFAIAMPKPERPIAEWRSALSPPPRYPSSRRRRKLRQNNDYDMRCVAAALGRCLHAAVFTPPAGCPRLRFSTWGFRFLPTAHPLHEHRRTSPAFRAVRRRFTGTALAKTSECAICVQSIFQAAR